MGYQTILSGLVLSASIATAQAAPILLASSASSDGAVSLEQQENHLRLVLQEDACARMSGNGNHAASDTGQSLFLHGIRAASAPGTTYRIYLEVTAGNAQNKPARIKVGELNFYGLVPGVGRNLSFLIPSKTIRAALLQPACEIHLVVIPNKPVAQGSRPGIDRVELWLPSPAAPATK